MKHRLTRVLDASAIVALFRGHRWLLNRLVEAEQGWWNLVLPAVCMAEAETTVRAGHTGWEPVLLTPGVLTLPLAAHAAVEVGSWQGPLSARHAVHEAHALRAVVVTCEPGAYSGLPVALLVV